MRVSSLYSLLATASALLAVTAIPLPDTFVALDARDDSLLDARDVFASFDEYALAAREALDEDLLQAREDFLDQVLEARGATFSKIVHPDRKAKYSTGNPKPETPKGEFRQHTAGRKDDYFGDWQTMTKGVNNPAAGKGRKRDLEEIEMLMARGATLSKMVHPDRKAKYPTGNPKPETPKGEFRQHTAGRKDDYFGDWQTMAKGVNNPAAGKGRKRDLEEVEMLIARGATLSKMVYPDRKAKYPTGNPKPETPKGEFRQHTAGRKDDYFGDWQTMTKGVNNPAAGKGKKRDLAEVEMDWLL